MNSKEYRAIKDRGNNKESPKDRAITESLYDLRKHYKDS
jgi:hypothetical protein